MGHHSTRVVLFLVTYAWNVTVFAAQNRTVDDNDPAITYSPQKSWSRYPGNTLDFLSYHSLTQDPSATASFNFTGTAIYFLAPRWPYQVTTVVSLDSGPNTTIDLQDYTRPDTGGGTQTVQSQIVWNTLGLADTQHNLLISVGPGGYAVVDALTYTTEDTSSSSSSSSPSSTLSPTSTSQDPNVASPTVTAVTPSPKSKSKSVVAIALGSVFGIFGLFVIVGGLWYFRRRKRRISGVRTIDSDDAPHATSMVISTSAIGPNVTNNMGNRSAEPLGNGSYIPQPGLSWNSLVPSSTTTGRRFDHHEPEMGHTVLRTTESSTPQMAEGMRLLAIAPPSYESEAEYHTAVEGSDANHGVSRIQQQQQKPGMVFLQYNQ